MANNRLAAIIGNNSGRACEMCGQIPPVFHGTVYKSAFCLSCFPRVSMAVKRRRTMLFRRQLKRSVEKRGFTFVWVKGDYPHTYRCHERRRSARLQQQQDRN